MYFPFPGPRFVLNPIKIFSGSFTGATLWDNPHYITPTVVSFYLFIYLLLDM